MNESGISLVMATVVRSLLMTVELQVLRCKVWDSRDDIIVIIVGIAFDLDWDYDVRKDGCHRLLSTDARFTPL